MFGLINTLNKKLCLELQHFFIHGCWYINSIDHDKVLGDVVLEKKVVCSKS